MLQYSSKFNLSPAESKNKSKSISPSKTPVAPGQVVRLCNRIGTVQYSTSIFLAHQKNVYSVCMQSIILGRLLIRQSYSTEHSRREIAAVGCGRGNIAQNEKNISTPSINMSCSLRPVPCSWVSRNVVIKELLYSTKTNLIIVP